MADGKEKKKLSKKAQQEIVREAREYIKDVAAAESDFRSKFIEDLRFTYDDDGQWETSVKAQRVDRPCYTFNRTEGAVDQVVGDQRQTRPSIKIRGTEDTDKKLAETMDGLVRNIEAVSNADTVQDHAFTFAVAGGYGCWRVVHEFSGDDTFDQDIKIEEIPNPLTAYFDHTATDICKRDARKFAITERITEDEFKATYPNIDPVDFTSDDGDGPDWYGEKEVRIAEYYRKVPTEKQLLQLSDGRVVYFEDVSDILDELEAGGITVTKRRQVKIDEVEWFKLYGDGILKGPITYQWKYIPAVPVYGKRINIDGEWKVKGLTRNAKDPQRSYNYIRSVMTEKALMSPKFSYILTPEQIKGYDTWWADSHSSPLPYILYNPDPEVPGGAPLKAEPSPVPIELVSIAQMDADDIKSATGFFDAGLGQKSNETSGVAIRERRNKSDVGSFVYVDNLSKAIQFTGEILVDMIPRIYDTERTVRILGEDGKDSFVTLNEKIFDDETGRDVMFNDLSVGKYDVAVSIGPSYLTQRQESAEQLIALAAQDPELLPLGRDIIIKNLDIPGSTELEKRFRKLMIEQGLIKPNDEELQEIEAEGQKEPAPEEMLAFDKLVEEVEKLKAQTQEILASTDKEKAEAIAQELENEAVKAGLEILSDG